MPKSETNEAVAIAAALRPTVDEWERESSRSCVRMKKMTVATVYNSSTRTIGVREAFSASTQNVPCVPGMRGAFVGDPVWVQWLYGDKSTMCVVGPGDVSEFYDGGVNPNILDNWYFAGGGSQQGGGQFPINQRGNTTYPSGYGYTIDRWKKTTTTVTLYSSYVQFKNTSASTDWIVQPFPFNEPWPFYKFVTGTILFQDGTLLSGTIYPNSDVQTASTQYWEFANASWGSFFLEISATGTNEYRFVIRLNAGQTINVVAVKMEIGTHQTLAYYDLAAKRWKPREIPEYTDQLSRCQRYFYRINRPVATTNTIALMHAFDTNAGVAVLPVPHMRGITSVITSHTFRLMNNNGTTVNVSAYSPRNSDGGVECSIDITAASASLTKGNIYILTTNGAGYMDFNADL